MELFSVASRLRGAAAHVVYMQAPAVLGRSRGARLDRQVQVLELGPPARWSASVESFARAWVLASEGEPGAVVRALAVQENKICDAVGGADAVYTLILFPEVQVDLGNGRVRREVRLAAVRGIFGSESPGEPPSVRSGVVRKAVFREPRR